MRHHKARGIQKRSIAMGAHVYYGLKFIQSTFIGISRATCALNVQFLRTPCLSWFAICDSRQRVAVTLVAAGWRSSIFFGMWSWTTALGIYRKTFCENCCVLLNCYHSLCRAVCVEGLKEVKPIRGHRGSAIIWCFTHIPLRCVFTDWLFTPYTHAMVCCCFYLRYKTEQIQSNKTSYRSRPRRAILKLCLNWYELNLRFHVSCCCALGCRRQRTSVSAEVR